jgi:lipid A 3-O-deacylase
MFRRSTDATSKRARATARAVRSLTAAAVLGSTSTMANVLEPSAVFAQAGVGDQSTQAYLVGASWDLPWQWSVGIGYLSAYFEGAFGRWTVQNDAAHASAWPTQIDATPVLRFHPVAPLNRWFAEIGVGANYIVPVFHSGPKRFSTEFNFGDHAAIGRQLGSQGRQELSLRIEHFSNAGIDHPNPGENFVQLRYAYRLGR